MRWTRERKTNALTRTVKPCGPVPATLGSTPGSRARGDGGKKARFTGESTEQPLNHRAGNAVMLRHTCSDYARLLFSFCKRGCGCGWRPAFPAPSSLGGHGLSITRAKTRRGNADACCLTFAYEMRRLGRRELLHNPSERPGTGELDKKSHSSARRPPPANCSTLGAWSFPVRRSPLTYVKGARAVTANRVTRTIERPTPRRRCMIPNTGLSRNNVEC